MFCGLCEWRCDNLENLETHLKSCEVYECEKCDERFSLLKDVKIHIENEHGKETSLIHLKINRVVEKIVDAKKYSYNDVWLFVIIVTGKAPR